MKITMAKKDKNSLSFEVKKDGYTEIVIGKEKVIIETISLTTVLETIKAFQAYPESTKEISIKSLDLKISNET